ncbi:MAG: 4-hydroxy-tetrahydrodipicolinate reductase, partial [Chloroflexi bacterium]|nr:4-hydroxy-tetrahydrodipicolinate reductase [Chloroflexota bacterium]
MPDTLRVVVHGIMGRMGREVLAAVSKDPGLMAVGGADIKAQGDSLPLPDGSGVIPVSRDLGKLLDSVRPQVVVDFSVADAALQAARMSLPRRVHMVVGTTGLTDAHLKELDALAREHSVGAFVAPNFALGAVLLIQLARTVGRFFDYADIIEAHHETKIDAPSGTALAIARALAEGRGRAFQHPAPEKEP